MPWSLLGGPHEDLRGQGATTRDGAAPPEFLHRVDAWRLRRHMPPRNAFALVRRHARSGAHEGLIVAQRGTRPTLPGGLQPQDGPGELATSHSAIARAAHTSHITWTEV